MPFWDTCVPLRLLFHPKSPKRIGDQAVSPRQKSFNSLHWLFVFDAAAVDGGIGSWWYPVFNFVHVAANQSKLGSNRPPVTCFTWLQARVPSL